MPELKNQGAEGTDPELASLGIGEDIETKKIRDLPERFEVRDDHLLDTSSGEYVTQCRPGYTYD